MGAGLQIGYDKEFDGELGKRIYPSNSCESNCRGTRL